MFSEMVGGRRGDIWSLSHWPALLPLPPSPPQIARQALVPGRPLPMECGLAGASTGKGVQGQVGSRCGLLCQARLPRPVPCPPPECEVLPSLGACALLNCRAGLGGRRSCRRRQRKQTSGAKKMTRGHGASLGRGCAYTCAESQARRAREAFANCGRSR